MAGNGSNRFRSMLHRLLHRFTQTEEDTMADKVSGQQYGTASQEAHKASGYRLPDHFYKAQEVDKDGNPVVAVPTNENGSSIDAATPQVANKAVLPVRKTPAKAAAKKVPAKKKGKK